MSLLKPGEKKVYTKAEAAEALGVSVRQITRLVRRGDLHPARIGRLVRFSSRELDTYLASCQEEAQ